MDWEYRATFGGFSFRVSRGHEIVLYFPPSEEREMKYAIMSDVHANPKALEVALVDALRGRSRSRSR